MEYGGFIKGDFNQPPKKKRKKKKQLLAVRPSFRHFMLRWIEKSTWKKRGGRKWSGRDGISPKSAPNDDAEYSHKNIG